MKAASVNVGIAQAAPQPGVSRPGAGCATERAAALAELLNRVARHDVAAFAALYRETAPVLARVASKIVRKPEWTEDVLQDSYVKVWRFAHAYEPSRASVLTWMSGIVRNQALDQLRRNETVEQPIDTTDEAQYERAERFDDASAFVDAKRALACLERLAPEQRQTITLAYLREYSHTQIAGVLGTPIGTVKARIRLGLVNLKRLIEAPAA